MKALLAVMLLASALPVPSPPVVLRIIGPAERFAPGIASTQHDEIRLTLSPDGNTALWFSRNRPGGLGATTSGSRTAKVTAGGRPRQCRSTRRGATSIPHFPQMGAWCISARTAQAAGAVTICIGSAWGATVDSGSQSILAPQ